MAQTLSYNSVYSDIVALKGESFNTTEQARVKALINQRARAAYRESDLWENFLILEERTIDDSTSQLNVPYVGASSEASAFGATTDVDTFKRVWDSDPFNSTTNTCERTILGGANGAIITGTRYTFGQSALPASAAATTGVVVLTSTASGTLDVYVGGKVKLSGFEEPSGFTNSVNGEHDVFGVTYETSGAGVGISFLLTGATTYNWVLTGDERIELPTAFCAYKKQLTATYGTDAGETSTIPKEWAEYIIHGVVADMHRADGQSDVAALEERFAQNKLNREMERLDRMHTAQLISAPIRTHQSNQSRIAAYT